MESHRKGETGNANLPEDARESHDRPMRRQAPGPGALRWICPCTYMPSALPLLLAFVKTEDSSDQSRLHLAVLRACFGGLSAQTFTHLHRGSNPGWYRIEEDSGQGGQPSSEGMEAPARDGVLEFQVCQGRGEKWRKQGREHEEGSAIFPQEGRHQRTDGWTSRSCQGVAERMMWPAKPGLEKERSRGGEKFGVRGKRFCS